MEGYIMSEVSGRTYRAADRRIFIFYLEPEQRWYKVTENNNNNNNNSPIVLLLQWQMLRLFSNSGNRDNFIVTVFNLKLNYITSGKVVIYIMYTANS